MSTPPLLLYAEGRKPKARKAPVHRPKEISLHMSIANLLRQHCRPEWQWFHVPNGEVRDVRTAVKLKRMGVKRGIPDFCFVPPTGEIRFLKLKRQGETLSDDQEAFQTWCIGHGVPHAVAFTFDEALAVLDQWRCLRIPIGGAR